MSIKVTLDIPEELLSITRTSPEEFVDEMRLAAAVKWYEMGKISQSKAAQLAGITRAEFLDVLALFKVSPFQTTSDELKEELSNE